jgi:pimeloyl-ACP methyl ester carboxylesterase
MDAIEQTVEIPTIGVTLEADMTMPAPARGVVLFAHGSGSSRHSPRNRYVAGELQGSGLGTVLVDLLTSEEEQADLNTGQFRFDIRLLAQRLAAIVDWLEDHDAAAGMDAGLFGASTGAAAALVAAAECPGSVSAVVSRGGRPDLAGDYLELVTQPTLLIVGERDPVVIGLNHQAMEMMTAPTHLEIVPGASHLFEEPGALEEVARLTRDWFVRHLGVA